MTPEIIRAFLRMTPRKEKVYVPGLSRAHGAHEAARRCRQRGHAYQVASSAALEHRCAQFRREKEARRPAQEAADRAEIERQRTAPSYD